MPLEPRAAPFPGGCESSKPARDSRVARSNFSTAPQSPKTLLGSPEQVRAEHRPRQHTSASLHIPDPLGTTSSGASETLPAMKATSQGCSGFCRKEKCGYKQETGGLRRFSPARQNAETKEEQKQSWAYAPCRHSSSRPRRRALPPPFGTFSSR